jgi:hypothetical protein
MQNHQNLASATFDDQDAGSGPVHSSPSLGPMTTAIRNISSRHIHDVSNSLTDERQFLRSWRRQLQDCMNQQQAQMIQFLLSDTGANADDSLILKRCNDVLTKYSKHTWNFASSIPDLSLPLDTKQAHAELEQELGIAPAALRDILRKVIRLYVNTASAACSAETKLEEKLNRLDTIAKRIDDLMFLEPTLAMENLEGPVRTYLDSVLEKISLQEEYTELLHQYKKFAQLKGLVSLANFQRQAAPTCQICMTKEITTAVTPCGHTYCDDCCRNQMTSCYMCRVQIRDRLRLYFS